MAQGYRREFLERLNSGEELSEYELLNIILGNAYGGRDMSAVSAALLERFPGVSSILDADFAEIITVKGVSESVAAYLKSLDRARKLFGATNCTYRVPHSVSRWRQRGFTAKKTRIWSCTLSTRAAR